MRDVLVKPELQPLGIDHDQLHLIGPRAEQQRQDHRVDRDALAGARRSGGQQVRHLLQVGDDVLAADVLAERERQLEVRLRVLGRLQQFAQHDRGALVVRHFDADSGFAGNAIDAHRFGFEREAEIVAEPGDFRVLDSGFGLELERGHDRAGMDLLHRADNFKFGGLLLEQRRARPQFLFVDFAARDRRMQQRRGWEVARRISSVAGSWGSLLRFGGGGGSPRAS